MTKGANRLIEQIGNFYLNEELSDVTIVVEGVKLPVHRFVLVLRCEYFKTMFESGMIESTSNRVEIRETPIDVVKTVLKWIYTGTIHLTAITSAFGILRLTHMYQIKELVDDIVEYLQDVCTVKTVCTILNEAVELPLKELTDYLINFVKDNSWEVFADESFEQLLTNAINMVLVRVDNAFSFATFRVIVQWIKANPSKSADFPKVLKHSRILPLKIWLIFHRVCSTLMFLLI